MASKYPRRIKLVNPRLQFKLIGCFVGLSALTLLVQFLLLASRLSETAANMPAGGSYLSRELPFLLGSILLFSFCVLLPASALLGVLITFRIAGPAYRFEQHLRAVARGEDPGPCRIREGDEFQDLCQLINEALEAKTAASTLPQGSPEELEQAA